MKYLKLFEEADHNQHDFERLMREILVDLTDQGFLYRLGNSKKTETTYVLEITHKGKKKPIPPRFPWSDDETIDYTFRWSEVKDTISTMVSYLTDVYPKLRFTEFVAEGKFAKGRRDVIARYGSLRSTLGSFNGVACYDFNDFTSKLQGNDRLTKIEITLLVRFRGKTKSV